MAAHPVALVLVDRLRDRLAKFLDGGVGRVVLVDAGLRLHHLADGPEADARAVRQRAALPPPDQLWRLLDPLEQLRDQPRLADPGDADQRHELRLAAADGAVEGVENDAELPLAADEGRERSLLEIHAQARLRLNGFPDLDRRGLSLGGHRFVLCVLDPLTRRAPARLAGEDAVHRRRRLQSCRRVDDVTRRHAFARFRARAERYQRLAGVDGDAKLEVRLLLAHPVADRERRAHRAFRIVLVGHRRAEERDDGVADELLAGAAEALEPQAQALAG